MMKVKMKSFAMFALTAAMTLGSICSSYAATTDSIYKTLDPDGRVRYLKWMSDDKGTWYQYTDDGSYPKGQWIWISPVEYYRTCFKNGEAECIYIKDDGYVFNSDYCAAVLAGVPENEAWNLFSSRTPDGYSVSVSGQWVKREGVFNEEIITKHFAELES